MNFDSAKENIQPLAAGRNASILQAALQADSHQELEQQRRKCEEEIQNYVGEDPLEPWFEYIYWIEQSFPSGGKESGLEEVLLKCLTKFEKDVRYHQDRRMIKLYIKYIDTHENPQECYQQLYNQGIGTMVSDLYICWAYYYDLSGNFRKADQIFRRGLECHAQPLDELQEAHQHFGFTMSQRILYDDDNSKQKYQSSLQEKRQALTSLKSHKKRVGSVRTGTAIKSYAPGKVQLNSATSCSTSGNVNICVLKDENLDPNAILPLQTSRDTSKSVVRTILDSARKQENVKEPGPWNKAHDKQSKEKLFASESRTELGFEILEDEDIILPPIKGTINYGTPFAYFDGFVAHNGPQDEWNLPVTLENELIPRSYPTYDKCLLYPQPNVEYSIEELGCYFWCRRRNIENSFTKKYDKVWKTDIRNGIRMYPNFAKINNKEAKDPVTRNFDPNEANVSGKSSLVFDPSLCYPSQSEEEFQFEEIMYHRWKSGERKLKYGGNETIAIMEEMEETICLPKETVRRKSFFPTRKSIAPSQYNKIAPSLEETEEDYPTTTVAHRSGVMDTSKKIDREKDGEAEAVFEFKTPAAPRVKQQKQNFQIYEEEENNYEANETCSTQVFNCFLKAQSVSTPKAITRALKPTLSDRHPVQLNFPVIENVAPPTCSQPTPSTAFSPPEYNDAGLTTLHGKQLSTIMETSEQATGNTGSTKSSISSVDFEVDVHQSRAPLTGNVCALETVEEAGSLTEKDLEEIIRLKTLKSCEITRKPSTLFHLEQKDETVQAVAAINIFEDKTETVPKIIFTKAGNFSRLENREDTAPSIKPVKLYEDTTQTMTKFIPITNKPLVNNDEMLELFARSPPSDVDFVGGFKNKVHLTSTNNKSIFASSAFMNFGDSPAAKQKCDYSSPEMKLKCSSLTGMRKKGNLSVLPNFSDEVDSDKAEPVESSFLSNLYSISGNLQRHQKQATDESVLNRSSNQSGSQREQPKIDSLFHGIPKENTSYRQQQSKEDSILPGFLEEIPAADGLPRQRSKEDSFLSGFPSVNVGSKKIREDSFMSYLSSVGAPKSVPFSDEEILKKSNNVSESLLKASKDTECSFMIMNFSKNYAAQKTKADSFKPNMSNVCATDVKDSINLPNLSTTDAAIGKKKTARDSIFAADPKADAIFISERSIIDCAIENLSIKESSPDPNATKASFFPGKNMQKQKQSYFNSVLIESITDQNKSSTQNRSRDLYSFDLDIPKSPQRPTNISFPDSKIIYLPQEENALKMAKMTTQSDQSASNLSFLNSFNETNPSKPPHPVHNFSIFMDSNCQKSVNEDNKFSIFEDPPSKKVAIKNCISLKTNDFFEDNIRTEAFQANMSMIKNSTWLPNHGPRQSQIKNTSLHIKEEVNTRESMNIFPKVKTVMSIPPAPIATSNALGPNKSISVPSECIEIAESDDDQEPDVNLGKSIYYEKTPRTPKIARLVWSPDGNQQNPELDIFIHHEMDMDQTQQLIDGYTVSKDLNPFNKELKDAFLFQIDFTNYIEKLDTCMMVGRMQPLRKDCSIEINGKAFHVLKIIGEGAYGTVYCAKEPQSGRMFALKQERPANLWEYYICLELRSRLNSKEILSGFINIEYALIGNNAGILMSQYSAYGSLITVCNKIKKETLKNVDEYVVMHMVSQLLLIMDHLHASNIIHADVKADNFLLMEKLVPGRKQPTIQLIDFGASIDMRLLRKNQTFRYVHDNESFKCIEMREKRPWTYQLDLFGLAGVIHVLLFGKYMEVEKRISGWTHKTRIPRYFNKSLWETIFQSLLNIDDCQTMPNLQNLRAQLLGEISENDKSVCQKIVEFNRALDL